MNTADCKTFIANTLGDPKNKVIHDELVLHHEASGYKEKFWSRASKKKIRTQDDLEDIEWLVDDIADAIADQELNESLWFDPAYSSGNFKDCVMRLFIHREVESMFGIITDPTDSNIVCWVFQVD
jgi:hypothetical protein